jgi:peptidoglycan hydrolase-like protein with peptidoglycan-binding domain
MRLPAYLAFLCVSMSPILTDALRPAAAQQPAQEEPAPAAKPLSPAETYAAMTLAERTAIQSDLVWTGHYDGIIDGDFGDRSLAAVRAFQKASKHAETGILNPRERAQLAARARARPEEVGWRRVNDSATGVSMGLPAKLVPQETRRQNGIRWASKDGDIVIETFRVSGPTVTLAGVAEDLRKEAGRKVDYDIKRRDFFVLIGSRRAGKFYIRAHAQDQEVRGFSILYDAGKGGLMEPITVAVSNAFAPFSGRGTIQVGGTVARRKVEYTTGLIASAAGDILADREATEGCNVITIPRHGPAVRVADDPDTGLALLRVHGVRNLRAAALAGTADSGQPANLIGIADPYVQKGGSTVTTVSTRLSGSTDAAARTLDPVPPPGFSGAAAVDRRGRLCGMVLVKPQVVAGPATDSKAVLVPAATVSRFLSEHQVMPAAGSATVQQVKASVVRVICVRS